MKKLIIITLSVFLLTACGSSDRVASKPRIPQKPKPQIPTAKAVQANLLGSADIRQITKEPNMERIVARINNTLDQPNISTEEVERGWYYGKFDQKKYGTPSTWFWIDEGPASRWISPIAVQEVDDIEADELCRKTAGYYIVSCIEREVEHCEYIPQSECKCISGSAWVDVQGCILTDENGGFVRVTSEELQQGWYTGLPNEKRYYTPLSWVWIEDGRDSRWQTAPNN